MISVSLNPKALDDILDPAVITFTNEFYLLENLTARLLSLEQDGSYKLDLASNIMKIDARKYEIEIKESYFSNGDLITLDDVKNSILRVSQKGSSHTNVKELIESLDVINKKLVVVLKKPSKSFFYFLSLPDLGVLHKSQYSKDRLKANDFIKISSGPFTYSGDSSGFYLIANSGFKLTDNNYPRKIKLVSSFNSNVVEQALKEEVSLGQTSIEPFLRSKNEINRKPELRFLGSASDSLTYIFFNRNSKKFKNKKLRQKISQIIQKKISIDSSLETMARKANQYFPPESKAFLNEHEVEELVNSNNLVIADVELPRMVRIHSYTTAFDVTSKVLVEKLKEIKEFNVEIVTDVNPKDYVERLQQEDIDLFLNIMSTDFRTPTEAINIEYFSEYANLFDESGDIKKNFDLYQSTENPSEELYYLKEISKSMLSDCQFIPLFHLAIPFFYNSKIIDADGLNHLFILNFWKLKLR